GTNIGNPVQILNGSASYLDSVSASGTVRGRIGYAPANWLVYATGGLAWSVNQYNVTQIANGAVDTSSQERLGWAAGAGVEAALIPHWTVWAEYLYTGFGKSTINYPQAGINIASSLDEQQVRVGFNYRIGDPDSAAAAPVA